MGINVNIYNIVLFNLGWIACVLGGNTAAAVAVCAITWLHLQHVSGDSNEWILLAAVTLCGLLFDSFLFWNGFLEHADSIGESAGAAVPPLWMICLWWLFATTLGHSLQWFRDKTLFAVLAGAVAGPLAYISGANLSNVTMAEGLLPLAVLSVFWAVFLPVMIRCASKFQRRYGFA